MPSPNASARAAAAAGFIAVVGAIVVGALHPTPNASHRHTRVDHDGGLPPGSRCYTVTARASPQARALFGLDPDGGDQYVRVTVAYTPDDAGIGPSLPAGMDPLDDTATDTVCPAGAAEVEGGMQGDTAAPWQCACPVSDSGALVMARLMDGGSVVVPAWPQTFHVGDWLTDAGTWIGKACEEFSGSSSWVPECGAP